jgi:hypothetical protein
VHVRLNAPPSRSLYRRTESATYGFITQDNLIVAFMLALTATLHRADMLKPGTVGEPFVYLFPFYRLYIHSKLEILDAYLGWDSFYRLYIHSKLEILDAYLGWDSFSYNLVV